MFLFTRVKHRLASSPLAQGASFALLMRIFGAALAYLTQFYLARALGAEELGIFVFAWTCLTIIAFLTPVGFDVALVRFVASLKQQQQWGSVRGLLAFAHLNTLVVSFAAAMIGMLIVWFLGERAEPYREVLLIAFVAIPLLALVNLHEGIARGFQWIYSVSLPNYVLRPGLFLLGVVALGWFGNGLNSRLTIIAMLVACGLTFAFQAWRYRLQLPTQIRKARPERHSKLWLITALPMVLVVSFEQLMSNTDIIMLGILLNPEATGVYNIGVRIVGVLLFTFYAVSAFSASRIAELYGSNELGKLMSFARKVRWLVTIPTWLGIGVLVLVGEPLLGLFGSEFESAYYPMVVLSMAVGLRALAGPIDNMLAMTGKQGALAKVLGVAAAINVMANILLIPMYGSIGAACATAGCVALELCLVSWLAGRHLGFYPWLLRSNQPS